MHVDDVGAVVAAIVGNEHAAGRPFNLVDCYARHVDGGDGGAGAGDRAQIEIRARPSRENAFSKEAVRSLGLCSAGTRGDPAHSPAPAAAMGVPGAG